MNQEEEVKIYRSYPAKWGILFTGINKQYLLQVSITNNSFYIYHQQTIILFDVSVGPNISNCSQVFEGTSLQRH